MRYYIIFGITIILSLIILYYPSKYLAVYNKTATIEYYYNDQGYKWIYEKSNDNIEIEKLNDSKWILHPKKDGKFSIVFYYTNTDDKKDSKYDIHYEFKVKNEKMYWLSGFGNHLYTYPNPY